MSRGDGTAQQHQHQVTGFLLANCTTARNVSKTPPPPQSLPFILQPAPETTSETTPTPRNLFLNLSPATILQQTSAARSPSVPCKPLIASLLSSPTPSPARIMCQHHRSHTACPPSAARMAQPPRSLRRRRQRVGRIPGLRRQPRARFELRDAPRAQRVA